MKLARERRKRKSRIRALIFFFAFSCIITGLMLSLKSNVEVKKTESSDFIDNTTYSSLSPSPNQSILSSEYQGANKEGETSYDDELLSEDDSGHNETEQEKLTSEEQVLLNSFLDSVEQAKKIADQFSHTVVSGDNLKNVLELSGVDDSTSQNLVALYPELKNLKPGQQVYWILDQYNELEYLNWLISEKEERIYERKENAQFSRKIIEKKSTWKKEVLKGKITNSLKSDLKLLGLDNRKINQLSSALQWQVNLSKLRKGDKFSVLISREYLGDKLTGQGNVEAIHLITGGKSYYAVQADNGRFYNRQGETVNKGFARIPLQRQARISSPFNPRRRHPLTGAIRPHKGVDFALPRGTPIIAPADGSVEKVAYQRGGAGHYIVLRHGREYQTIYMHLSKSLVKPGQSIKRGQRIALSGNTGISTGPHLHYEFHINGRPVNPMTVKLPNSNSGMSSKDRKNFLLKVKSIENRLKLE